MGTGEDTLREALRQMIRAEETRQIMENEDFKIRSEDEINSLFDTILNGIKDDAWQAGWESGSGS